MGKVVSLGTLKRKTAELRKKRKKVVFTNGCFDILHSGHVKLFKKARSYGDVLVVAVNADASVRRLKGRGRPVIPCRERMVLLAALCDVDYVLEFREDTPLRVIKELKPAVVVKGGDWKTGTIVGEGLARVIRAPYIKGFSTTGIIERIRRSSLKK